MYCSIKCIFQIVENRNANEANTNSTENGPATIPVAHTTVNMNSHRLDPCTSNGVLEQRCVQDLSVNLNTNTGGTFGLEYVKPDLPTYSDLERQPPPSYEDAMATSNVVDFTHN